MKLADLQKGVLLKELSTFGIGGPAEYFLTVKTTQQLQTVLALANREKLRVFIVGRGSNCLFDDRGFEGLVIQNRIDFCRFEGRKVEVGAGYNFSLLATKTANRGLSGLEFGVAIPGTVGGAIFMNAGANGQETCAAFTECLAVDFKGELLRFKKEELKFDYRFSSFHKNKAVLAETTFELTPNPDAKKKQLEIIQKRKSSQPLQDKSAGCVFKNPLQHAAGYLIEQVGLKGERCGLAEISNRHANFIVNRGGASSEEVIALILRAREKVLEQFGIELEVEVRAFDAKGEKIDL